MLGKNGLSRCWQLGLISSLALVGAIFCQDFVIAQVLPDDTLGSEGSEVKAIDELNERIDGGAARGANLFHSFQEFNVGEGRGVYFANPEGIANILSRVTGGNPSNILGRLGVLGDANLFLLNPNGILFGPNASLDINGSFVATTASGIALGNQGFFSASQPEQSNLLSVNPGALFFSQAASQPGNIINLGGNLAIQKNLTLSSGNLNLQGQLLAGGDLTLQATNRVRIRDSVANPFIAGAGGQLWVQGQEVDIFALNHSESGFFSGGDLILRSTNPVGGDAHFWSAGDFRIEQLDGNLGDLYSPYDPIIRSLGDVSFNNYIGASLHILAGGAVNIGGTVIVTDLEIGTAGSDFLKENVQLTDGTAIAVDGSARPTLDIRAGVAPAQINNPGITGITPFTDLFLDNLFLPETSTLTNSPTSANITIGSVFFDAADGLVLITNQYQPNTSLLGGAVTVRTIRTDNVLAGFLGNSGSVIIDSRSDIRVTNAIVSSSSSEAGDITLLANEAISLSNGAFLDASTLGEGNGGNISLQAKGDISLSGLGTNLTSNVTQSSTGQGGNINIRAGSLSLSNGVFLDASTFGRGDAGNISIQVNDAFSFSGSAIFSDVGTEEVQATGQGGNISIEARSLSSNDTQISASTFGQGSAGSISIKTDDFVILESGSLIFNTIESNAIGDGGGIRIETRSLLLTEGSQIGTSVLGQGNAGDIFIQADDTVSLVDDAQLFAPDDVTLILSRVQPGGVGTSGDITINTGSLSLSGAQISASLQGEGQAGRITIQAQESVSLVDESTIFSSVDSGASGNGGEIKIRSDSLSIQDGSQLLTIVRGASRLNPLPGRGNAGNINLDVRDLITVSGGLLGGRDVIGGIASSVDEGAEGKGGNIQIEGGELFLTDFGQITSALDPGAIGEAGNIAIQVDSLSIANNAQIFASTIGAGDAGNLRIQVSDAVSLDEAAILSTVEAGATGKGGEVSLEASLLTITNGAAIIAATSGEGDAGSITIRTSDSIVLDGGIISGQVNETAMGDGQLLTIETGQLVVREGSGVSVGTLGAGNAGDLTILASESVEVSSDSILSAQVNETATGDGGDLTIETGQLVVQDGGFISVATLGDGEAGRLTVNASNSVEVVGGTGSSGITASTLGSQPAGNILMTTGQLIVRDNAVITTATSGAGNAGDLLVDASEAIVVSGSGGLNTRVEEGATGEGGDLTLTTGQLVVQNGAQIAAGTFGRGSSGKLAIAASDSVKLTGAGSGLFTQTQGRGNANDLTISTGRLTVQDNAEISAGTFSNGLGGRLTITAEDAILVRGAGSGLLTQADGDGKAGDLAIQASSLILEDEAQVSARSQGQENAGNITIRTNGLFSATDSEITTAAEQASGGAIKITAQAISLQGDSDIRTNVANGAGGGGNITLSADSILAFDDSDILASAEDGRGGDITLNTPVFFGSSFEPAPQETNPETLDNNDRVDINASGAVAGAITVPDVSFIQNSLAELSENVINTETLVANSCVVPSNKRIGTFIITGTGGLPVRPGEAAVSPYPTGTVRTVPTDESSSSTNAPRFWQIGDPIVEPQGVYRLNSGKLVMSRECSD